MTQVGKGLIKASPKPMLIHMVDVSTPSTDKSPSPELFSLIKAAASSLIGFKELWGSIKTKGADEGFNEDQLMGYLKPLLKEKLTDMQIKYLTHEEYYKQKSKEQYEKRVILPEIAHKKELEPSNYIEETTTVEQNPEAAKPSFVSTPITEEATQLEEEDPKDLEISFLKEKVSELEEALKKTQQFTPATQLESQMISGIDDIFEIIKKQADGTHSFFYDAYGIDLFKNRELSQLKNSGVKVFRRLYFEV